MKILIVPDVHGRDFWKEPCEKWEGKIVFLGDYHDPYPFQVSVKKSLKNLEELVHWYESKEDKPIMLFGNHDLNYLHTVNSDRFDYYNASKVKNLISKLNPKLFYIYDRYLFSHSGILPQWMTYNNLEFDQLENLKYSDKSLYDISPSRGGHSEVGSPVWGDVMEYNFSEKLLNYYQIFGHTQLKDKPIISYDYACLDVRQCFILDTETGEIGEY
jgi:hypothetical protein